ncbi:protein RBL-like isoform X2 [Silene latifolia]
MAFNRRGTLLAAGCSNGSCVIWDFETRVIAKELKDEDCTAVITSVCWSKYGHRILVSMADKRLILWDVATGVKVAQTTIKLISLHAQLHPGSSIPSLCLVNPIYSAPFLVDLNTGKSTVLPISVSECVKDSASHIPSCFNIHGDLVYVGNSKGEILIIDHHSIQLRAVVYHARGAVIKNIVFSRNGMYLLTNSSDGTIRVFENRLPLKDGLKTLCKMGEMLTDLGAIGTKSLGLCYEFHDPVARNHWKAPCFSRNGEWIIGGSTGREHKIHIWDSDGRVVKILKGPPKVGLISLAWHPVHPIIVSLSMTGLIYIWAKAYAEKWSAFYPDFKELDHMEEYVEREDEFDIVPEVLPEIRQVEESVFNHDEEVDIITMENESMLSDSEMSEEELCFLQSVPRPDTPDQQQDGNHGFNDLNQMEGTDGGHYSAANVTRLLTRTRSKRRRKPTEKLLELLGETAKKQANWPNTGSRYSIDC